MKKQVAMLMCDEGLDQMELTLGHVGSPPLERILPRIVSSLTIILSRALP